MEDFLKMKWNISGPHELEHDPEFIPEDTVAGSYVFAHLDGAVKILKCKETAAKSTKKMSDKIPAPGVRYTFTCKRKSRLSVTQQRKCLNALELMQSGTKTMTLSDQTDMRLYNNLKRVIIDENVLFLEYTKQHYSVRQRKIFLGNRKYLEWGESAWRRDLSRRLEYPQFYVDAEMLPYSYSDTDVPIEMQHVANVLELGSVSKFNPPSLMHSYSLDPNSIPTYKTTSFNSKLSVSKDANIDALLQTNSLDIVTSSSALKKLMDFTNLDCTWCVPVIIKALPRKGDWTLHKTVFLDKPLRKLKPSTEDIHEYCVKKLLRENFCSIKAFSFQNEEAPINTNKDDLKNTPAATEDFRDRGGAPADETAGGAIEPQPNSNHNVSYRIWTLRQQEEQSSLSKTKHKLKEIRIMIRCKLDGCEVNDAGMLQPLTVSLKLEYQLEYGGSIPTKTELLKEWASIYIKPCSQLRRVRTHFKSGEVIAIEQCNIQKINGEAQSHHAYKPRLGLGALYKMSLELMGHEPGNYLLMHLPKHGPFVLLLKEAKQDCQTAFDLHTEFNEKNLDVIPRLQRHWCPPDVNLILPRHRLAREMPGMFKPSSDKFQNKKSKMKKKKPRKRPKRILTKTPESFPQ